MDVARDHVEFERCGVKAKQAAVRVADYEVAVGVHLDPERSPARLHESLHVTTISGDAQDVALASARVDVARGIDCHVFRTCAGQRDDLR